MSLLSTLDEITDLQYEEEQQEAKERSNTPQVPRTNSLEDLGIKVLQGLGLLVPFITEELMNYNKPLLELTCMFLKEDCKFQDLSKSRP